MRFWGGIAKRMGILSRYVLRQIAIPSGMAIVLIAVVGVANEIQEKLRNPMLGQSAFLSQLTVGDFGRLVGFMMPILISFIIPITYLIGILLAFGNLAQNNEIIAMKAAGIPLKRVLAPVLALGLFLSGLCYLIVDRVQPWAFTQLTNMMTIDVPLRASIQALPPGIMHDFNGWKVYFARKDPKQERLENIVILIPTKDGRTQTYYAASAQVYKETTQTSLELKNVHFIPPPDRGYVTRLKSDTTRLSVPNPDVQRPPKTFREMTMAKLWASMKDLAAKKSQSQSIADVLREQQADFTQRLSMVFACVAITLVAAPIGIRARGSGRSYTFAAGFVILLGYYILGTLLQPHSLHSLPNMLMRAFTPNVVMALIGCFLIWRVDRV